MVSRWGESAARAVVRGGVDVEAGACVKGTVRGVRKGK